MTVKIWKSYICTAVKETNRSNPHIYEHCWTSSWNKTRITHIRFFNRSAYDFHIFKVIIHHLDGLFGSNIMTSSQLAC